jgi:spermidine synthase
LKAVLAVAFFLSGAAALVLETLCFRQAGLALGNGVWASSIVLASFMGGLALGNALAARYGERGTHPLVAYALLEVVIAATGVTLVFTWPSLGPLLAPLFRVLLGVPFALNAARVLVAFVLMLVPAAAMGATLPLLARALGAREPSLGRLLGWLYGWNTLGAVAGAVAGEAVLVGWLGLRGSALFAGGLNLAAAVLAFSLASRLPAPTPHADEPAPPEPTPLAWRMLGTAFLCGASLLALEVVWFRVLSLFLVGTSLTFALMLAVVLLGIGAGGLLAWIWLRLDTRAERFLRPVILAAGALVVVTYSAFQDVADLQWFAVSPVRVLALGLRLMLPVSLLSGIAFTLLGHRSHGGPGAVSGTVGRITLANTLGALVGSLLGGFVLLPLLGMERSFAVLAVLYGVAAFLLPGVGPLPALGRVAQAAVLVLYALSLVLFPFGLMQKRYLAAIGERFGRDGSRIVAVREGPIETAMYLRRDLPSEPPVFRLITNGYSMSGTALASRRYMSVFAWWPSALHPDLQRALLISYGVGVTARALVTLPSLQRIDVVDISRVVLQMSSIPNPGDTDPLKDPRVRVHVEDGRHYLQTSTTLYDLITGEPPPPHGAGVVSLYTREYFRLMRQRLAPGGIVTYWLPVNQLLAQDARAIVGAFCGAFADCSLWAGTSLDWMLVGTNGLAGPVPEERFSRPWKDERQRAAMAEVGLEVPEQLGALFIGDATYLKDLVGAAPPLVDDFPRRIMAQATQQTAAVPVELLRRVADSQSARARFAASPYVAGLWPRGLRERTLDYFQWQHRIDEGFRTLAYWKPPSTEGLPELDRLLTHTPLRTLALWSLGTGAREQAEVARLPPHDPLADRDYRRAADAFLRAPGEANVYRAAYALALAGRLSEVAELEAATRGREDHPPDDAFWAWMGERFGPL